MVDRRGAPWTGEEIAELVERIRGGAGRSEVARAHGRTDSAIESAVWRMLPEDRRPAAKSESVQLLCEVLGSGGEVDWWARYREGRAEVRSAQNGVSQQRKRVKGRVPLPEIVQVFAEQPAVAWEPLEGQSELGPLIAQGVAEINDPRKRYIMACRLGVIDGPNTLAALGQVLGITGERVRQLQNAALMWMQRDARRPGSAGAMLAVVFDFLDKDPAAADALAETLLGTAEEFQCNPFWLVKLVSRMGGRSAEQAEEIAAGAAVFHAARRRRERELAHQEQQIASCDRIVDKWIGAAFWPARSQEAASAEGISRRRMPTPSKSAFFGSYTSEKTRAVIYFESLLEESAFTVAEGSSRVRSYQEQPCTISYVGEDGQAHTYYPDLLLSLDDGRVLLVEVKPLWQMALTANRIKCGAGQRYAAENGWGWVSVGSRGQTYRDLEERQVDDLTRTRLTAALTEGPISWAKLQQLRLQTPITAMDVAAFAVQDNAGLALTPYRLYHVSDV